MALYILKSAQSLGHIEEDGLEYRALLEPEFETFLSEARCKLGGATYTHSTSPFITMDGEYLGGLRDLVNVVKSSWPTVSLPDSSDVDFEELTKQEVLNVLKSTGNVYCYMDFKIGEERAKRVYFELYQNVCPKTCENFSGLCSGMGKIKYRNSLIHRVVPGGWIQGGDILSSKGDGGSSIYGDDFEDECFSVRFDTPGVLAMANRGPHTNGSQFFITTAPLPSLKNKSVAFGRVVRGMAVIRKIESVPCLNERPEDPVKIEKSGAIDLTSTIDVRL
jgi:peptidyl-prolyl cis-trans isomerase-like 6